MVQDRIKVLIVDDSLFIRMILSDMLSSDPEIEIVGSAKDGVEAVDLTKRLDPDIVTMDLVMPRSNGIQALKSIKELDKDIGVLMLSAADRASAEDVIKSLEIGAFDFILKPSSTNSTEILRMKWDIITRIKAAFHSKSKEIIEIEVPEAGPKKKKEPVKEKGKINRIIAIGSSTGGPNALRFLFSNIPWNINAPIVIAQHMPKEFTESFAERLNDVSEMNVVEAKEDDVLKEGYAYISPGNKHIEVMRKGSRFIVQLTEGKRIRGGRPSADMLMQSIAEASGEKSVGVILTGMGSDGARGMKQIKNSGGATIAQNEKTSLIWGMPHAAIRLGVVDQVLPLRKIPRALLSIEGVVK